MIFIKTSRHCHICCPHYSSRDKIEGIYIDKHFQTIPRILKFVKLQNLKMFIKGVFLLALACIGAEAMVCFKGICDKIPTREPLTGCKGSVIKNGGFCNCYDVCAKVKNNFNLILSIQFFSKSNERITHMYVMRKKKMFFMISQVFLSQKKN